MSSSDPFRFRRSWRRRLSGLLSAALCVWLVAFATHVHASDEAEQDNRSGMHLCGVCTLIPTGAGSPDVVVFAATFEHGPYVRVARETQVPASPPLASYRSRAPPAG